MLSRVASLLYEAWDEVKVQKARVVMSLIAVVAAVAAMTSVVAVGEMMVQVQKESTEAWIGRAVTLSYDASEKSDPADAVDTSTGTDSSAGATDSTADQAAAAADPTDPAAIDPVGEAFAATMKRFKVPYWSRFSELSGDVALKEVNEILDQGTFHGRAVEASDQDLSSGLFARAVDPAYATIFRMNPVAGRWLKDGDERQIVTPIVLNTLLWEAFGKPELGAQPLLLSTQDGSLRMRVVGVVDEGNPFANPSYYIPYGAAKWFPRAEGTSMAAPSLKIWVGESGAEKQRLPMQSALSATLGDKYEVTVSDGNEYNSAFEGQESLRIGIFAAGFVVIALGALGLLNVAVVTMRQRIREIGVRRALGASARRVFFAVFLESVVATVFAGILGVMLAVLLVRFVPPEALGLGALQDTPPFPVLAALAGLGVSALVGALCGLIPATMAVSVKPIDAIRY